MARSGINKALVQKARDALLARGERPSIDAIRVELGNTGSKSTIHRYLKELEGRAAPLAMEPGVPLSERLGQIVGQLAEALREEATETVAEEQIGRASCREKEKINIEGVSKKIKKKNK